jgi:hypothetical protein
MLPLFQVIIKTDGREGVPYISLQPVDGYLQASIKDNE